MKKIRKKIFEMVKNEYRNIEKEKFIPGKTRVPVSGRTYDYTDINSLIETDESISINFIAVISKNIIGCFTFFKE